jgi:predicted enzyme related to lactoylglutathione lyase
MIARLRLGVMGIVLLALVGTASADEPAFPPIGTAGKYLPGKFIWFDLVTNDLTSARQFYGAVFGWKFRTIGSAPGSYTLIEDEGRSIGGMFMRALPPEAKATARWLALISVKDPAEAARYVEQHGGKVIVPPANYRGRGTHALFRDPEGAVFGVLHSKSGDPPDTPVADDDFFWVDLLAPHPAQAAEFYKGLAGYEVNLRDVGPGVTRAVLASGGYARAGIAPLPPAVKQPGWLPYILVQDVAGTLAKVRAAGGKVLVEPRAELLDDNLAIIADPSGGVLGVVNWSPANVAGPKP